MLNNLFSSFDEKNFFFSLIFLSFSYLIFMLKMNLKLNSMSLKINNMYMYLNKFIAQKFIMMIFFLLIFFINLISLNFYNFSFTSQISFNLPLNLMLWLPIFTMYVTKKNNKFLMHMLPLSTPLLLIPVMILIEMISFFIRPLTLLLRLSINMIAGHVLVTLISEIMLNKIFMLIFPLLFSYMLLKFMVSFIQAYIITTLIQMYSEEIYVNK